MSPLPKGIESLESAPGRSQAKSKCFSSLRLSKGRPGTWPEKAGADGIARKRRTIARADDFLERNGLVMRALRVLE